MAQPASAPRGNWSNPGLRERPRFLGLRRPATAGFPCPRESGNVLYDLVRQQHTDLGEAEFVDNVSRNLRRGEFLLLIIGDGIQEGAANIVDFVQRYSGLHFNLAMVEAALYRDSANTLIVQPRVLARTEIVQRFVVEGSFVQEPAAADVDVQPEPLSEQEEQNLRFWTAVLKGFSFSDPAVDVPNPLRHPTLPVTVRNAGHGGWALRFHGFLQRNGPSMGCYLSVRKDYVREVRAFEGLKNVLDELPEFAGIEYWKTLPVSRELGFIAKAV